MVLRIQPLDKRVHQRGDFSCGEVSLDTYLQRQASQDLKKRVATVFVLVDEPDMVVLGYYTLSAYTVDVGVLGADVTKGLPRYPLLPATLLGRLAVDQDCHGQGFGEFLLIDALRRAWEASQTIGSLVVVVEALNERARRFYLKYGFIPFLQAPLNLYLPMKSIEALF
ncbi:GNAT family N-acetyltransferase [Picosynechococcus sp. PCC 7117]|uniref:GNAT family N-acetyltransferase n=1 Tax=Picosynechococcus sp. PCC 7117 TaxID=195498 RepID=UPI0008106F19|nr:GNAT family N-acetyltransferase [Picosynechococcus sp. PCC 7117]ANV89106.1 GCN5 family acetyltransferase [Picosynechococcus sp. PCC 7117]